MDGDLIADPPHPVSEPAKSAKSRPDRMSVEYVVYEHQRRYPMLGYTATMLPTDPWNWSDRDGTREATRSGVVLPAEYEWLGPWTAPTVQDKTDANGWEYAFDFTNVFPWHPQPGFQCWVRRRKWTRMASGPGYSRPRPPSPPPSPPMEPQREATPPPTPVHSTRGLEATADVDTAPDPTPSEAKPRSIPNFGSFDSERVLAVYNARATDTAAAPPPREGTVCLFVGNITRATLPGIERVMVEMACPSSRQAATSGSIALESDTDADALFVGFECVFAVEDDTAPIEVRLLPSVDDTERMAEAEGAPPEAPRREPLAVAAFSLRELRGTAKQYVNPSTAQLVEHAATALHLTIASMGSVAITVHVETSFEIYDTSDDVRGGGFASCDASEGEDRPPSPLPSPPSRAPVAKPLPECAHVFVVKEPPFVPTTCVMCKETIWPLAAARRCMTCEESVHEPCFAPTVSSKATPLSASNHTHAFVSASFAIPKMCAHCGMVLLGFRRQGLQCLHCPMTVHRRCAKHVPNSEALTEESETALKKDMHKEFAMATALRLLSEFHKRHERWAATVLNPKALWDVYRLHRNLYTAICASELRPEDQLTDADRMTDIANALRFATAAYGKVYEHGHMGKVHRNVAMRLSKMIYAIKPSENDESVLHMTRLPPEALVHSKWGCKVFEPSYAVVVDHNLKWIVLLFRGSLADEDFLSDACGDLTAFYDGQAHMGIATMADTVLGDDALLLHLRNLQVMYHDYAVVVTGHSLGGGITTLVTVKLLRENIVPRERLRGYAFAPPPIVTNTVASSVDDILYALVAGKDIVPRLQVNSFDRLGVQLSSQSGGTPHTLPPLTEECHLAGSVYLMPHPAMKDRKLMQVQRTSLLVKEIYLSSWMIQNHLPDTYALGLRWAREELHATHT